MKGNEKLEIELKHDKITIIKKPFKKNNTIRKRQIPLLSIRK